MPRAARRSASPCSPPGPGTGRRPAGCPYRDCNLGCGTTAGECPPGAAEQLSGGGRTELACASRFLSRKGNTRGQRACRAHAAGAERRQPAPSGLGAGRQHTPLDAWLSGLIPGSDRTAARRHTELCPRHSEICLSRSSSQVARPRPPCAPRRIRQRAGCRPPRPGNRAFAR